MTSSLGTCRLLLFASLHDTCRENIEKLPKIRLPTESVLEGRAKLDKIQMAIESNSGLAGKTKSHCVYKITKSNKNAIQ